MTTKAAKKMQSSKKKKYKNRTIAKGPRLMRETLLIFLRLCLQCAQ